MLVNRLVNNKSRFNQKTETIYASLIRKLYQKNVYRDKIVYDEEANNLYLEKIVYDEEANNFYNIIEPHYKCYDKDYNNDYKKKQEKQHNSSFCKLCKGTGWISWTTRNNQLLRYTQCHQCQ